MNIRTLRKPFVLLEILIAIALVALFALPLSFNPTRTILKQVDLLEEMECERIADLSFAEVKEILLKNELSWDEIGAGKGKKYPLPQKFIHLKGFSKKAVDRRFSFQVKHEKEGVQGATLRHLIITIDLTLAKLSKKEKATLPFEYHLFAKKVLLSPNKPI